MPSIKLLQVQRHSTRERSPAARGFTPSVLDRVHTPDIGLAIWHRITRLNLSILAGTLLVRPPFTRIVVGTPDVAARSLCHDLLLFHWPLYVDVRRLADRYASLARSPVVRIRLEH